MSADPRPTLSQHGLRAAVGTLPWGPIEVVAATGSTNADVLRRAAAGAAEGLVVAADEQTAGRGRMGRTWVSPPGGSVSVSVLLRPRLTPQQAGWLPLMTGLAVAAAVAEAAGVPTLVKWPNDVMVAAGRPGKIAGILVERTGDAACVGFGINTAMSAQDLPVPEASSIVASGAPAPDPDALVGSCLHHLHRRYDRLIASGGDAHRSGLAQEYAQVCTTIGADVVVHLPTGALLTGRAEGVDEDGRLRVLAGGQVHAVAAGDVAHVR